ncbi:MAG: T9SS type A sorting domain-containing protein [Bacteroidota bacterium]
MNRTEIDNSRNRMIVIVLLSMFVALTHIQQSPGQTTPYAWKSVIVGCGGFVPGIVYHPVVKDLMYARTDIGGAYRWDKSISKWIPLNDELTINNLDAEYMGVLSIAVDRNDTNRVYMECGEWTESWAQPGALFSSTDKGNSWTIHRLSVKIGGDEDGRGAGERLQVDPNLNSILFMGTTADGLWKSTNYASTWTRISSFTPTNVNFVLFDSTGGSHGDTTQRIFVAAADTIGKSLYRSDDGGASWRVVEGQPGGVMAIRAALADSILYITFSDYPGPNGATAGSVWKYSIPVGNWTDISPSSGYYGFSGVSVCSQNPDIVIVSTLDRWSPMDEIYLSTNGGGTWSSRLSNATIDCSYANYNKNLNREWLACLEIDPFDSSRAMFGTGYGIWACNDIYASTPTWFFRDENVEETQTFQIVTPPYTNLLSAMGDVDGFRHDSLDVSPPDKYSPAKWSTTSIAFAENAPEKVVKTYNSPSWVSVDHGAYSLDGTITWHDFDTWPAGTSDGGVWSIALSADGSTIVWSPIGSVMSYSTDDGSTWTACGGGVPLISPVADRVNTEKFYAYDGINGQLWISSDGGKTFQRGVGNLPDVPSWLPQDGNISAVPGHEEDLWICCGQGGLYRTTNSGVTATKINAVTAAYRAGFGKALNAGGYPSIYMFGTVKSALGFFRSDDIGASWTRINDDKHQYGKINQIMGDPRVYGRCYVTPVGRGILYGEPVDSTSTSVESKGVISNIPAEYGLFQNYPNPFNPSTVISYQLPVTGFVALKVYDVLGREVETLVNERQNAGSHSVTFNANNLPSGVYFYRMQAGSYSETKKLILLR